MKLRGPNNNLYLWMKTEPVAVGVDATVYIRFLGTPIWLRKQNLTAASSSDVTDPVFFLQKFYLFFGHRTRYRYETLIRYLYSVLQALYSAMTSS